jgi:hypothetical protein
VVFAGNINLREKIRELMDEIANVQMVNNVRPDLEVEQLDDTVHIVGELYEDIKINRLPGMHELSEWSSYPIVSTAHAFARISQNLAALQEQKVFGVDLGSNSVTLVSATPEQVKLAVHTDLGMGSPMLNLLEKVSPTAINHWMPSEISAAETADFVFNKALNPHTIPMTETELHLEQAVAREIIRCSVLATANDWGWFHQNQHPQVPPFGTLLARGSILANSPRPGQVILLLLDALQPTGIFSIALDQYGVLPTLGALATHEPLAVVQSLEGGVLTNLGWIIAPAGKAQQGKKALKIAIESEQVRFEGEIEYGKIELFPIAPGEAAKVTIKPTKRFDIGLGPGKGTTQTLYGGIAGGLVVDARGRPISLPRDDADRRSLVRKWLWDMGG